MKKIYFLLFFSAFFLGTYAQTYWSTEGNTALPDDFLGTTNIQPLIFKVNNAERMRFLANGNLGIGTAEPEEKVHVVGKMLIERTENTPSSLQFKHPDGQGGGFTLAPYYWDIYSNDVGLKFNAITDNGATTSQRMILTGGGNLGIGITDPAARLHVNQNILAEGNITTFSNIVLAPDNAINNNKWEISRINTGLNFAYNNPRPQDLLFISNNGNIGIGKTTPSATLDVNGSLNAESATIANTLTANTLSAQSTNITGNLTVKPGTFGLTVGSAAIQSLNYGTSYIGFNAARNNGIWTLVGDGVNNGGSVIWNTVGGQLYFALIPSTGGTTQILTDAEVMSNIKLHLTSSGKLKAKEVEVTLTGWPDYVFEPDYPLMSLQETENFIKENKHLPALPSAKEVEENGINLGEMNALLLRKVEELTLYILQMEQRVSELENQKGGE